MSIRFASWRSAPCRTMNGRSIISAWNICPMPSVRKAATVSRVMSQRRTVRVRASSPRKSTSARNSAFRFATVCLLNASSAAKTAVLRGLRCVKAIASRVKTPARPSSFVPRRALCFATAASRPTLRTVCIRIPSLTKRLIRRTSRAQRLSSGVKPQPSALFRFKTTGFSAARGAARVKRAWALAGCSIKRLPQNTVFG